MDAASLQLVKTLPLFSTLTDEQLACIASGELIDVPAGAAMVKEGDKQDNFYAIISGEIQFWRSYDRQDVLMATGKPGHFMGEMAIFLDAGASATTRVSKDAKIFRLSVEGFWQMMGCCPSVAKEVMRTAAMRFRNLEGFASQREKLVSLGTMAAGLAHELNNPASAALRAASYLQQTTDSVQSLLCELGHELSEPDWDHLLTSTEDATRRLEKEAPLDSLVRSDRESALEDWLESHQVPESWKLSGTFADAGVDAEWLDALIKDLPSKGHVSAIQWVEARLHLKLLLKQIETSTSRVSELVKAVKSYTHMDQTPTQEIDVHEGIESTLTMLGHKLKSVTVRRSYDRSVPRITANAGELNQVWTNLIDNAIDATNGSGKICVGTYSEPGHVLVEIVDNGEGIPADIQKHIFEPFFTTKPVGSGTGLGLVISNRIVADNHGGEIEFESKPGETCFRVRLPVHRSRPAAPGNNR